MAEILQQLIASGYAMWQRRWYAIAASWLVCMIGWGAVAVIPDKYQASARILVDTETLLGPLMSGLAVQPNMIEKIRLMRNTLISRPNLEKVARMTDLDLTVSNNSQMDELLRHLQDDIDVVAQGSGNLFLLSYANKDPQIAKRVVQAVLTIFVETNLGASRTDLASSRRFIDDQLRDYEKQLNDAEARRAEFKQKNMGNLPGDGTYYQRMEETGKLMAMAQQEYNLAASVRNSLKQQLDAVPAYVLNQGPATGPASTLPLRIAEAEKNVSELKMHYTDQHPDVIALKKLIESLKEQMKQEQEDILAAPANSGGGVNSMPNPIYEQIKYKLVDAEAAVAQAQSKIDQLNGAMKKAQEQANSVPVIEAEMSRLNRDYEVIKKNYDELLQRREAARLAQDMETKSDKVQFKVIDPPDVGNKPASPNRPLLLTGVLVAGLGVGLFVAFSLSQIHNSYPTARALREAFSLPVLGSVSAIVSPESQRQRRIEVSVFAVTILGLLSAYGMVLAIEFFKISSAAA